MLTSSKIFLFTSLRINHVVKTNIMKLSTLKNYLVQMEQLQFDLPNNTSIPAHFHITEVGKVDKTFIDCGGTLRSELKIGLQLWYSVDTDHRLSAQKLLSILNMAEDQLDLPDAEIEVEYQAESIGKYGLGFVEDENGARFKLLNTQTACLAEDQCSITEAKEQVTFQTMGTSSNTCAPGSGCC